LTREFQKPLDLVSFSTKRSRLSFEFVGTGTVEGCLSLVGHDAISEIVHGHPPFRHVYAASDHRSLGSPHFAAQSARTCSASVFSP
jgi:hypothetical protein